MKLSPRAITGETPKADGPAAGRRKIVLHPTPSVSAIRQIAEETLASRSVDAATIQPIVREIGGRMPDGSICAGVSPETNNPMYVTPSDASLTMKFNEAQKYAARLNAHGHKDWRVPTKTELNVLFNNRAAIGGFNVTGSDPAGWYWSASPGTLWGAWGQRFSDGHQFTNFKDNHSSVRCVR